MYLHIVMMAFNKEVTPSLRTQVEDCFQAVLRDCEGVVRFDLVDNQSRTSASYTHALLSVFANEATLAAYRSSAAHDRLTAELGPHIKEVVVLDSRLKQDQSL